MAVACGIVGLPNVGKSTLFNALTRAGAASANYPFCTIEPNTGVVDVPDPRLAVLAGIVKPHRILPAAQEFVDIAGLVRGASKGEGLGNAFLGHIRETDAIVQVVRCFEDADVTHVEGGVDPERDLSIIETELIIKDLDARRKGPGPPPQGRQDRQQGIHPAGRRSWRVLADPGRWPMGQPAGLSAGMKAADQVLRLPHPQAHAAGGQHRRGRHPRSRKATRTTPPAPARPPSARLPVHPHLLQARGGDPGSSRGGPPHVSGGGGLGRARPERPHPRQLDLLGLQTYFTAGVKEVRAWTIHQGDSAPQAAGVIHTDFEKGFIRAQVIAYEDFIQFGGEQGAKDAGKMRTEGKEYVVKDGDLMNFLFNV